MIKTKCKILFYIFIFRQPERPTIIFPDDTCPEIDDSPNEV
jgi:hypothetical protein